MPNGIKDPLKGILIVEISFDMTLRLYDKDLGEVLYEKVYQNPPHKVQEFGIEERVTRLRHSTINGFYKELFFEGVHIGLGTVCLSKKLALYFESDFETVEMHFALKGRSSVVSKRTQEALSFDNYQHNIIYARDMCGKVQWEQGEFQLCEINLSPLFFKKYLPEDVGVFAKFKNAIEKSQTVILSAQHHLISMQMYRIIDEIITCQRQGFFKRMFLEAKVIELLLLQLEQIGGRELLKSSIKKSDIDKIYAVREYILKNLTTSCSLIDLAREVGTNEFTLKKGFKELFGTTVFGFWIDAKLDAARLMLIEQEMTVGEVSHQIGYKNSRHFSTAFKKKYGMLPSQLKR